MGRWNRPLNMVNPGSLEYIGSLLGGIALALWAARLSSVYLQVPALAIACLLLYAILQLSGVAFRQESDVFLIVSETMMLLKVFTVFVCAWLIGTGRLLHYFEELRQLHGLETTAPIAGVTIDERWQNFMDTVPKGPRSALERTAAPSSTQGLQTSTESTASDNPLQPELSVVFIKGPESTLKAFLYRLGFGGSMLQAVPDQQPCLPAEKVVKGSATTAPPTSGTDGPR
jgi:hypothetical protein